MITSYHPCHYHGNHMAPSRVNVEHVFICECGERSPLRWFTDLVGSGIYGHRERPLCNLQGVIPLWLRQ